MSMNRNANAADDICLFNGFGVGDISLIVNNSIADFGFTLS